MGRAHSGFYDQAYFDRWYRDPGSRMWARADVERKVRMAVAVAEYLLDRPLRSVLDVGCGEGPWQKILKRLREPYHMVGEVVPTKRGAKSRVVYR